VFKRKDKELALVHHLTSKSGLSENFISYLAHDEDNTIWACTPSGLDKISMQNNRPVIENLTRQNNIYQNVTKVVIDNHKTAWAVTPEGLIKITPENKIIYRYTPRLMLTKILTGPDTLEQADAKIFSHRQNNISFYFAAPSFLDEKQILYSYWLQGSNNQRWSDPSDNASVSFTELKPGNYTLNIKAIFPAGRYPEQTLSYSFSVTPPWWQTWWFRTGIGILGTWFIIAIIRLYYLGKLERQKTILEKQQAIEKERTRIATDMHDDLGAGLSRIKFLSETIGIKKQKHEPIEDEISSIRNYSHDMIDKMGEIVWALNEKNDSLIDLLAYTRAYAVEYLTQNGIRVTVETTEEFPPIFVAGEFRRNFYLAVKEALHNIVKHAGAEHVFISFDVNRELHITIKDDGCGFQTNISKPYSNGLINMQKRMKDLGGSFEIKNMDGTQIHLSAPLSGSP
jgi:signal transduction histidine kinase